jgi:hypothetical protein
MTSAMAAMEHRSKGQIGQPAACMIENNPVLSAGSVFLGRAIMAPPQRVSEGGSVAAGVETTVHCGQSTADVDNFVGNPATILAKPRELEACNNLLKS